MFGFVAKKIFGTSNDRIIKSIRKTVELINAQEDAFKKLSDHELALKTKEFKDRLSKGCSLESLLVESFAIVREAATRTLNQRHFDTQLIGGIVIHRGMIAEMKTGEGKTLSSTLPIYLNALTGKGVHVVTVNDYLAERDSQWMGKIFKFLGLSVACITGKIQEAERQKAYQSDILYGTNNEFGFDYLRDNLKLSTDEMVQRPFNYAIVDEIDSILIDEARTPLIISGPTDDNSELYNIVNKTIPELATDDYELDEKAKNISLTDQGHISAENILKKAKIIQEDTGLYDIENMSVVHHLNQALKAHKLFTKENDYIVKDGKVMIIDEFTGRIMDGRRYSDGLHQALEAKENVTIQNENQTLASVTFQNYFRMYPKLAGMAGTALTEANEFADIYKLEVIEIPTHLPVQRIDRDDILLSTSKEKYNAIIKKIEETYKKQQPILIGTISIEQSEFISYLLKKKKIKHQVLNAKFHAQEAEIIAQAGRLGAVTIATNMAGRGTDIQLGGNAEVILKLDKQKYSKELEDKINKNVAEEREEVLKAGGLMILGTERHESRRIDNQLRGRSGRQGDKGETIFYLSLEDDLMRLFGSQKIAGLLAKMGLKEGEEIIHPWISKSLEKAQQKVEARNYDIRKTLLKFDDVINDQRTVIYKQRNDIMSQNENLETVVEEMYLDIIDTLVHNHIPKNTFAEQWNIDGLEQEIHKIFSIDIDLKNLVKQEGIADEEIYIFIKSAIQEHFITKKDTYGPDLIQDATKHIMLITLDHMWKDHLYSLDHLRRGINLRSYAQKDPLNEYKMESFKMFKDMLNEYSSLVVQRLSHLEISHDIPENQNSTNFETRLDPSSKTPVHDLNNSMTVRKTVEPEDRDSNDPSTWGKVSRNEPCPCKSGKKYKQCHGSV